MADTTLHPTTVAALKAHHDDLTQLRRVIKEGLEETDNHIKVLMRVLNGAADQAGMDRATRKLHKALHEIARLSAIWRTKWTRTTPGGAGQ